MPLLAVKTCCHFKNSEYLQKILEHYSVFDGTDLKVTLPEEDMVKFDMRTIESYDYMEGKKKIEVVNYR
jgi:hypothetical protein